MHVLALLLAALPVIESINTTYSSVQGGTRVVLRGANFHPGPVRVVIGPHEARVLSSSDEAVVVETVATPEERYTLVLTRGDGATAELPNFNFVTYLEPMQRLLLPIVIEGEPLPGALGSRWITEIAGRNDSDELVSVTQTPAGCVPNCSRGYGSPHRSFRPTFVYDQPQGAGAFLYVDDKPAAALVSFNLRIRDVSREAEGWGTELPVVRESELFSSVRPLQLLDVPVDPRYRGMLRLYDADGPSDMALLVEVLSNDRNELLASHVVRFPGGPQFDPPAVPGYVQLDLASLVAPASGRVRLRISTSEHWRRFWGFVSVTSNATQQVTAITPRTPR
jgi:hypothetical protein